MSIGTVKRFSEQRGSGFIEVEGGADVFFHHSAINATGSKSISVGEQVTFNKVEGAKGPAANNVTAV